MISLLILLAGAQAPAPAPAADPRSLPVVDTALARMGGVETLARIERARYELITQWQRLAYDGRPYADQPSYEWHTSLRDYTIPAWRNTRRFGLPNSSAALIDIVRDSVAIRFWRDVWAPLNVAYVDERRELFTFAPERLMLLVRGADDLGSLPDTSIAGVAHARVTATIDGFPVTVLLRRTDGLPAMVRYVAAQPNDFGLAPLGRMEVEVWYSRWQATPAGATLPMQWDVRRAGAPYKRTSVLSASFDVAAAADSFAVSDSLRARFLATERRAMHDVPFDSARAIDGSFVSFGAPGAPAGAVRVGGQWILLETGQAGLSADRALETIGRLGGGPVWGAVVTMPLAGNGGVVALGGRPVHAAPGAMPFLRTALRNDGGGDAAQRGALHAVASGTWLHVGTDSLWLEPIDLPDAPGALILHVPSLRYVYSGMAASPLQREYVMRRARERGWAVERTGTARAVTASP